MCRLARGLPIEEIGEAMERVDVWLDEPGMKPVGNTFPAGPIRWLPADEVGIGGGNGCGEN